MNEEKEGKMNDRHVCGGQSYLLINIYLHCDWNQLSEKHGKAEKWLLVSCIFFLHSNENDDTQYVLLDLSAPFGKEI